MPSIRSRARPARRLLPALLLVAGTLGVIVPSSPGPTAATASQTPQAGTATARHPLDPLTGYEITTAIAVLRTSGQLPAGAIFPLVTLREPSKADVLGFRPGDTPQREALVVVLDRPNNGTYEAVVDLNAQRLISWQQRPDAQPPLTQPEYEDIERVVRADPQWQAAMRQRGITDFDAVYLDPFPGGALEAPVPPGTRLSPVLSYYRGDASNVYARPIEGVMVVVDVNHLRVVEVVDSGSAPLAAPADLDPQSLAPQRAPLPPLQIVQPQGPGFTVEDNVVRWQNWRFRFAMQPTEGLVLYDVAYEAHGRLRPILYRAGLSEMFVPYADPDPTWAWRGPFDLGEYYLGRTSNTLDPGVQAPENATFFDAVFADDTGQPVELPRAVALYERDGGILWTHYDDISHRTYARRARDLVIGFLSTVGNYDYGFNWIFREDGSLEYEAVLSGILLAKGAADPSSHEEYASPIAQYLVAPNHQHFFNVRLDFDLDGPNNSVAEIDTRALPPGVNPYGNAFGSTRTTLETAAEARRDVDRAQNRVWEVVSAAAPMHQTHGGGYALIPAASAAPYLAPTMPSRQRAAFVDHQLWVTLYQPDELYAAGNYPNQGQVGEGLLNCSSRDEPIVNTDVVLWYTFGITHRPRPEDWPVMPVARTGFMLMPHGLFHANPTLDVPPSN
jgi:primary-amine oxidase